MMGTPPHTPGPREGWRLRSSPCNTDEPSDFCSGPQVRARPMKPKVPIPVTDGGLTGAAEFAADAQTSEPEPEEPTPEAEPEDQPLAAPQSTTMSQLWEHPAQLTQAPVALPNGVLLCSQEDTGAQLRRLDVQGKEQWSAALAESCSTPLLVSADRVFVGVGDSIQALHLRSGEPLWTTPVPKLARESAHSTHGPGLSLIDPHIIVGVQRELMGLDLHPVRSSGPPAWGAMARTMSRAPRGSGPHSCWRPVPPDSVHRVAGATVLATGSIPRSARLSGGRPMIWKQPRAFPNSTILSPHLDGWNRTIIC